MWVARLLAEPGARTRFPLSSLLGWGIDGQIPDGEVWSGGGSGLGARSWIIIVGNQKVRMQEDLVQTIVRGIHLNVCIVCSTYTSKRFSIDLVLL